MTDAAREVLQELVQLLDTGTKIQLVTPDKIIDLSALFAKAHAILAAPDEPVAHLWQHDETGRITVREPHEPSPGPRWVGPIPLCPCARAKETE